MNDLDQRTVAHIRDLYDDQTTPDDAIRKTYKYALTRFGLACGDLGRAFKNSAGRDLERLGRRIGGKSGKRGGK